jgi:hypothetical chaperone protein
MAQGLSLGIDFGTTNTVAALAGAGAPARLVRFPAPEAEVFAFRSALSFHAPPERPSERTVEAGPWAIEAYVEDPVETRFIQSFKTFAASESFTETQILGRRYRFEDLLSAFLLRLCDHAGPAMADLPRRVIVGRPVNFAGAAPDPALALRRYEAAFARLGFTEILYAYEPVGAAFFFARELDHDATVLVGDFGGGTSDFSIIRFQREAGEIRAIPLGRSGVGVAGDAFDYRIIDNLVSPELGKGGSYRSFGKLLPIPNRYYSAFARWDQLALMRASRDMREIRRLVRDAVDPGAFGRLVEVLDENLGYPAEGDALGRGRRRVPLRSRRHLHRQARRAQPVRGVDRPRAGPDRNRRRPGPGRCGPGRRGRRPRLPHRRLVADAGRPRHLPPPLPRRTHRHRRGTGVHRLGPGADGLGTRPVALDDAVGA